VVAPACHCQHRRTATLVSLYCGKAAQDSFFNMWASRQILLSHPAKIQEKRFLYKSKIIFKIVHICKSNSTTG
jgi:hypothetical protein